MSDFPENNKNKAMFDEAVDISDIVIDRGNSKNERIHSFRSQIKDPFICRFGKINITMTYDDNGPCFEELLSQGLQNKALLEAFYHERA